MSGQVKSSTAGTPIRRLSLPVRRALIMGMYGGYFAYMLLRALGDYWKNASLGLLGVALFIGALGCTWALLYRTPYWNWGHAPDTCLDERELAIRNRCYRVAYSTYTAITLLPVVYAAIAVDHPRLWLPHTYDEVSRIVWGLILLSVTLPSALLAWDDRPLEDERES